MRVNPSLIYLFWALSATSFAASTEDPFAKRRLKAWHDLVQQQQTQSERQKLEKVNVFFNQFEYQSDHLTWGKEDYWATPYEFMMKGQGDCEDFAIAKFETLQQLGLPEEKLLLCYTKIKLPEKPNYQPHLLLAYVMGEESAPLLLDNFEKEIMSVKDRSDLKALYCFNHFGFWHINQQGQKRHMDKSVDIHIWKEMEKRMQSEERELQENP